MKSFTLSLLTAAIASTTVQTALASEQSEAKGFLDDSHLSLLLRNYYFNHDNRDGADDKKDWAQAALLTYQSGFTQGIVGFGLDAFGYGVLKLDGQNGGTGNLKTSNNGATDSFTHIGGAVKVRISNTTLKYGELQPSAPVFAAAIPIQLYFASSSLSRASPSAKRSQDIIWRAFRPNGTEA